MDEAKRQSGKRETEKEMQMSPVWCLNAPFFTQGHRTPLLLSESNQFPPHPIPSHPIPPSPAVAKALLDTYIVSVRGNKEKTGKKKEKLSRPGGGEQRRRVERK